MVNRLALTNRKYVRKGTNNHEIESIVTSMLNISACFEIPSFMLYPLLNYNKIIEIYKFQERHFLNVAEYLMFCHIPFDSEDHLTFTLTVFLSFLSIVWHKRIKIYTY